MTRVTADLFEDIETPEPALERLAPGALLLCGFAREAEGELLETVGFVLAQAPLRHLVTPGGHIMSVGMSNCGPLGWVSDRSGYRYDALDPLSGQAWPALPERWKALAAARCPGLNDQANSQWFRPMAAGRIWLWIRLLSIGNFPLSR